MLVRDIMTENVKACRPDTNLAQAAALMWEGDCGVLPVVDDGGKVIGIITDRDIAIALGTNNKPATEIQVSRVMSQPVFSCHPDDDIHAALELMRKDKVRRLPIISDNGMLLGILSMNDVALHAEKSDTADLTYEDVVNTMKAICEHRPRQVKGTTA
ncbi:MAG TPA: CBS domain-containing protein [Blastocatellia bacterium]|nr:CBS domain-containing protein [Blastocatellia bacterium]